ncbi:MULTISPECIES: hypothetical protein [unclassified Modestobacter]|uniref:hypothetical protein n=1 Tax=unclassified Modestobacter TaxID=2643866 RepID=UPI0022AB2739|nr:MULTISPECIES: hypothetical protein [unclassified Modestobacter]MCZ2823868.1 hypothetical protein [Modestobacter sp. VKM Ac-2981]MCZ2852113.1 hypothetical protein [Modestobacter sp. VKM Ac-2982]
MTGRTGPPSDGPGFVRAYRQVCLLGAVVGVAATLWAMTFDPGLAVVLGVLTVLLPTYRLVAWRLGRTGT